MIFSPILERGERKGVGWGCSKKGSVGIPDCYTDLGSEMGIRCCCVLGTDCNDDIMSPSAPDTDQGG
jgi:hypothetical protein